MLYWGYILYFLFLSKNIDCARHSNLSLLTSAASEVVLQHRVSEGSHEPVQLGSPLRAFADHMRDIQSECSLIKTK